MKVGTTDGPVEWLCEHFGEDAVGLLDPQTEVLWVHQTVVDAAFLSAFPNLKGVIRLGVGYDKVDLAACAVRGIQVANVPDYCTDEVAQSAVAFALDWARGHRELEAALLADPLRWQKHSLERVRGISEMTFGAVGVGRIGQRALDLARAMGFQVKGFDVLPDRCLGADSLEALLGSADVVSVHVPLDPETKGMLNGPFFRKMKPGSMLINTARGGLLGDSRALVEALKEGRLSGAALDVLPEEPLVEASPVFQFWQSGASAGKLRITPHNAFHSSASARQLLLSAAEEVERLRTQGTFKHRV